MSRRARLIIYSVVEHRSGEILSHHPPPLPPCEIRAALLTYYSKKDRRQGARIFFSAGLKLLRCRSG